MSKTYSIQSNFFSKIALTVIALFFALLTQAQKNIYRAEMPVVASNMIYQGAQFQFIDPESSVPGHVTLNPRAYLRLKADSDTPPFVWAKTRLTLKVYPLNEDGSQDAPYQQILNVEYNPYSNSGNFGDLASHEILGRFGALVIVENISTTDMNNGAVSNSAFQNITFGIGFEAERYYELSLQMPSASPSLVNDDDGSEVMVDLDWTPISGALEYDLEWTWVDSYGFSSGNFLSASQISFNTRDLELNSTRIRTKGLNYQIPLIFSKGFLIYRVRAVGRYMDDVSKAYFGPWSSGTAVKNLISDWQNSHMAVDAHESKMNWQFQASYAEEGKKKEVVSYFDGSLRNRQTVTKINSEKSIVVGETIYDAQGRPAVEVMPVPVNRFHLRYLKDLNRNMADEAYSHLDFDWEKEGEGICDAIGTGMISKSGSSRYYSKNNDVYSPFRKYVPDAFLYPFSQIEYTPDNTGRISRKGGVGATHQLGSEREMQFFYAVPHQEELNRLFGYHVGFASHYKKNITVDPNRQVSVSYIDPQGRTIATALSGSAPENLLGLEDEKDGSLHGKLKTDLLGKVASGDPDTLMDSNELGSTYNFPNNDDKLTLYKQIGVAGNNVSHNFKYSVSNKNHFVPQLCKEKYPFVYELSISLMDACGISLLQPVDRVQIPSQQTTDPFTVSQPLLPEEIVLSTGSYSILKELKVKESSLNAFADRYVSSLTDPQSSCYIDPSDFGPNINIDCNTTCQECTESIGTQYQYVVKQLNAAYNVTGGSNIFSVDQSTFAVSIISQPLPSSPINFGQPIATEEANGMAFRFSNDWIMLDAACDELCGITFSSGCVINERALLKDVSPNGQYGLVPGETGASDILSVFNENNDIIFEGQVNDNASAQFHWRHPMTPYLNPQGQTDYIEVQLLENGQYYPPILPGTVYIPAPDEHRYFVLPQNLANVSDFLLNWEESWANSLVEYHPEYCYLEYSNALCQKTLPIEVKQYGGILNNTVISSETKNLTSDEYDGYLEYLDTYEKAFAAGFFNLSNINSIGIFASDPYFSSAISGFETSALFQHRRNVLLEALNIQYEEYTMNSDGSQGAARLFHVAVQMVKCNSIQPCQYSSISLSSLTDIEKNRIWNTYKNLYLSLKSKVKHIFINVYAISKGCQNTCIGQYGSPNVTNSIVNYDSYGQLSGINSYISSNNPSSGAVAALCSFPEAANYGSKQKRFIPADFGYDSDININDAISQLTQQGNYQYYLQTGKCPLMNDLELFLNGYFEDINLSTQFTGFGNWSAITQSLTPKLFQEFTGQPGFPFSSPTLGSAIVGNSLQFTAGASLLSSNVKPLILVLPSNYSWNNYNIVGTGKWHFIGFSQFYYDAGASTLNGVNPIFAFKVAAKIQVNNADGTADIREVILTGTTLARIGECHIAGNSESPIGEELYPDASDATCDKKENFAQALKDLIRRLQVLGQVNNAYNLGSDQVFATGFLPQFFGIAPGTAVTWSGNMGGATYSLSLGNGLSFTMVFSTALSNTVPIVAVSVGGLISGGDYNALSATFGNGNSVVSSNGHLFGSGLKGSQALYFSCCSPCGEWDFNIDGSGDLCDSDDPGNGGYVKVVTCEANAAEEGFYEDNLEDVLNNYLLPGNHINVSGGFYTGVQNLTPLLQNFIIQSNLLSHFSALRVHLASANGSGYNVPVSLTKCNIVTNNQRTILDFSDGGQTNKSTVILNFNFLQVQAIEYIDVIEPDIIKMKYTDSSGIEHVVTFVFQNSTTYATNPIRSNSALFCNFLAEDFSSMNRGAVQDDSKLLFVYDGVEFYGKSPLIQNLVQASDCPCVPQAVEPVACDEQYAAYLNFLNFNASNISNTIQFLDKSTIYTKDEFCASNAQYLVESYIKYVQLLGITSTEHPNYLTIIQFGHTDLNYGYLDIDSAIQLYAQYNFSPSNNPSLFLWREYINTIYMAEHLQGCPPGPLNTFSIPVKFLNPCEELAANVQATYQLESYAAYIAYLRNQFIAQYTAQAVATAVEQFDMWYDDKEYQYTLYYYDQAGNLINTIAPEGVKRFTSDQMAQVGQPINEFRNNNQENASLVPDHTFKTEYKYNSLNQMVWQKTPDGGITQFAYDALGRIIASQNEKQRNHPIESGLSRYSYSEYDFLGRITEAGEIHVKDAYSINSDGRLIKDQSQVNGFMPQDVYRKTEITKTVYTEDPLVENYTAPVYASSFFHTNVAGSSLSHTNRNRVTGIFYYDLYDGKSQFDNAIFYNYDIHGNVKEVVNYITSLKTYDCVEGQIITSQGQANDCEKHLKRIVYDYDLISGNVRYLTLQPNKADQFIHRYEYDADNRLINSQTSSDGSLWEMDSEYKYYPHGPLARTLTGDKKIQGTDYAYTIQGWLKAVNGENIQSPDFDMGQDGQLDGSTQTKDAYGFSLTYFDKAASDYTAIEGDDGGPGFLPLAFSRNPSMPGSPDLYNGNIKMMTTAVRIRESKVLPVQRNSYSYDQLNRIMRMNSTAIVSSEKGMENQFDSYSNMFSYDRNGNILKLFRDAPREDFSISKMDDLQYDYTPGTNKLTVVRDHVSGPFTNDLKDQVDKLAQLGYNYDLSDMSSHNYVYDEIGQLIEDRVQGLKIIWKTDGKIKSIAKATDEDSKLIEFEYNGLGNRISKKTRDLSLAYSMARSQYYTLDAQANVLAVHELEDYSTRGSRRKTLKLSEHHIFGSSRIGLEDKDILIYDWNPDPKIKIELPNYPKLRGVYFKNYFNVAGDKRYELSNHLGDVVSVVNDKKIPADLENLKYFYSDVINYSDYYPFGMAIPNRNAASDQYRYGYQGSEKDEEIKGDGNSYTTHFRLLDPRLGRWLSIDPEFKANASSYSSMGNNPILMIDPLGNTEYESYEKYKKAQGSKAIGKEKWTGQDGHWLTADRKGNKGTWNGANTFNLKTGNQGQYKAFEQIRDLYKWIDDIAEKQGHEVRWTDGAINLVSNLSKAQFLAKYGQEKSFLGLLKELNTGIADLAVREFGKLLYGGGKVLKGNDAYKWDLDLVTREQRDQAKPIYQRYKGTLGLAMMEQVSYSNVGMFGDIPNFGMFRTAHRGKPAISLADDWGIRVDIPMLMLYPRHKPISIKGEQYIDSKTGTLNNRYMNYMKFFQVEDF
jgi:RHS repeat-associated protein